MVHKQRRFQIFDVATAAELAEKLTQHTWCGCNAFRWRGYVFANDAFSPDGAQEFAVIRESDGAQVESITASWMDEPKMLTFLAALEAGEYATVYTTVQLRTDHGDRCQMCA